MLKALTRDQLQSRKDKAARFVRDVLGDPDQAEEIEDESLEDYAERRKITLTNSGKVTVNMTKQELLDRVQDLEEENQALQDRLDAVADLVNGDDEDEEGGEDAEDDSADDEEEEEEDDRD